MHIFLIFYITLCLNVIRAQQQPNETIQSIDFLKSKNAPAHHTESYNTSSFVLRRGQVFECVLQASNGSIGGNDTTLTMDIMDKQTKLFTLSTASNTSKDGMLQILKTDQGNMTVSVQFNSNMGVGSYGYQFNLQTSEGQTAYKSKENIIVLFNPWSKDDDTYLSDANQMEEYLTQDKGKIYREWRPETKDFVTTDWFYDQYDLNVVNQMLKMIHTLPYEERRSPISISKRLTNKVRDSNGNKGLLVGRWSGSYGDGKSPSEWKSSKAIVLKYAESGAAAKYGQCWVFAGLLTTFLRGVGIPSRAVTNIQSAHDEEVDGFIDYYFDENGRILSGESKDSVWNFHVWSEAWFARKDISLPGGWQALDSTYNIGPASVERVLVKDKNKYNNDFLMTEVGATRRYFTKYNDGRKELINSVSSGLAKFVVTKGVKNDQPDMLTTRYVSKDNATNGAEAPSNLIDGDLEFLSKSNQTSIGSNIEVHLKTVPKNNNGSRNVKYDVYFNAKTYNGEILKELRHIELNKTINASTEETFVLKSEEYDDYLQQTGFFFQCTIVAKVAETNQLFRKEIEIELRLAQEIQIQWVDGKEMTQNKPKKVQITFKNPFSYKALTTGKLSIESGSRFMDALEIPMDNINPGQSISKTVELKAKSSGEATFTFSLAYKELTDIQKVETIQVQASNEEVINTVVPAIQPDVTEQTSTPQGVAPIESGESNPKPSTLKPQGNQNVQKPGCRFR